MRSYRNIVLGAALATLVVSGSVWAAAHRGSDTDRPVVSKRSAPAAKTRLPKLSSKETNTAATSVSNVVVDSTDFFDDVQRAYLAEVTDPNVPWSRKCQLAAQHGRLELLSSDIGGALGGTVENGRSDLRFRLLCPEPIAIFDIPADFVVHSAPHPEEVQPMSFETQMNSIRGEATNVGPFSYISLVGGNANGFESPGRTSLIPAADGTYAVDSTFNIGYRLHWVGAPDGPFAGASGVTEGSILMKAVGK